MAAETHALEVAVSTGTGRQKRTTRDFQIPTGGTSRKLGVVSVIEETVDHADFTDGGGAAGTIQLQGTVPAGAVLLGSKVLVPEGFAGDSSAALTIGDGSDVDRYMTGTPSVFATAASGIQTGAPSGNRLLTADNRPTVTVTSGTDWGSVTAGQLTISIYYIEA